MGGGRQAPIGRNPLAARSPASARRRPQGRRRGRRAARPDEAQVALRVCALGIPGEHGSPLLHRCVRAAHGEEREAELHRRAEVLGLGAQHAPQLRRGLGREPGFAQRDPEPVADVVELRAAVEGPAIGLDGVPQLAGLAVRVAERGMEVRELALGRGVERALRPRAAGSRRRTGRERARALELAALLVERR